jgi:Carboxypeptidase regulatory-like domain
MRRYHPLYIACSCLFVIMSGCSKKGKEASPPADHAEEADVAPAYHVDLLTAGSISGTIRFTGKRPPRRVIDMSEEPGCVEAHHGRATDESLVISSNGAMANAFIYVKSGLEVKRFETPSTPATIDQNGCWFKPRVLGIQTNQLLQITNSDPVTHNIHPMAQINREWNHSQGAGDAPLGRKFTKPEVMIRVKCNIHSWMHAFIGVVDNPYFAVTKEDGRYSIKNLPPGSYTIEIWQESLGKQERQVTVSPHSNTQANITFKDQ